MKGFRFHRGRCSARGGFNLVEVSFTIGVLSLAIVTLGPLLGMGLKTSSNARDDRMSAQIARSFAEQAKQGALGSGTVYLNYQGLACNPPSAAFVVQPVIQSAGGVGSQLALRVTPVGAPGRARVYAVVLPVAAEN